MMHRQMKEATMSTVHGVIADRERASSNPYVKRMSSATSGLCDLVMSITDFHSTPNPRRTKEDHLALTGEHAKRKLSELTAIQNKLIAEHQGAVADNKAKLDTKLNLNRDWRAPAILDRLNSIASIADKHAFLGELAKQNDGPAIASVRDGGFAATGIPPEQIARYTDLLAATHAPELVEERKVIEQQYQDANGLVRTADQFVSEYCDPIILGRIEREEAAAKAAEAALQPIRQ